MHQLVIKAYRLDRESFVEVCAIAACTVPIHEKIRHQRIIMHMVLPDIKERLSNIAYKSEYVLIVLAITEYSTYADMYGPDFINQLEEALTCHLEKSLKEQFPHLQSTVFPTAPGERAFVVPQYNSPQDIAYEYKLQAQNSLKSIMYRYTGLGIDLGTGFACMCGIAPSMEDEFFKDTLEEARLMISMPMDMRKLSIAAQFNMILRKREISTLYQPIINFKTNSILGWEALSRGPENSSFRSPIVLFETAELLGSLFALEKLCRETAFENAGAFKEGQKLFLNIHPRTMADPEFTPGKTTELMERAGLKPENIVFEITEQHSVQDFNLFYRTLDHYRSQGFKVAVDDVGAGYAGLLTIAELQPEFIKLDKSLIANIHRDPVKRALVETTVTFANKIGSQIIAEGIEKKEQAVCLMDKGVHCGQGYFLARPDTPKPQLSKECTELQSLGDLTSKGVTRSIPIGDLAKTPTVVQMNYKVSKAQDFFQKNPGNSSIIVADNHTPKGLVMEYHLNRKLSTQYGLALYQNRSVKSVMDDTPLMVDVDTPVEQVARRAMKRESLKAYDDVIVTCKSDIFGFVSVQDILNAMAKIQVEMAKGTNPLTGLPGNVVIEQEVESRIAQKRCFSIIYADLDHFKVYNDTYGFKNGDRIIRLAADILSWATQKHAGPKSRLCHIGGDDFVLITSTESVERICQSVTRCFGRLVKNCYCEEDQKRGWIKAKGRDGMEREFPLVSISLGVIQIGGECSLMEIGERAANIKKFAKSHPGNSVAVDRRPPLGTE